jgi:hypothetical protein
MRHLPAALAAALFTVSATAAADGPEPLVKATQLPVKAAELRGAGVPDAEVVEAVRAARDHGLKPDEAEEVLEAAEEGTRSNGKVDNLGSFVNQKLDEGLRGKELAAAIHAEHEARGQGKSRGKGKGHEKGGKGHDKDKGHEKGGKGHGKDKGHEKGGKGHDKDKGHEKGGKGHDKDKGGQGGGKGQGKGGGNSKGGNSKGGKGKGR